MSSNFENLPLPVNRDAQDYSRLVPRNSVVEIPVVGEFVYCKFSDGEIRVVINGKSTGMEAGDERRSGDGTVFRGVNLINDTGVDKSVIFVIGFGGFNRRIIRGEVSVVPQIRKADGSLVDDTRASVSATINYPQGDFIVDRVAGEPALEVGYENTPNAVWGQGQPGFIIAGRINTGVVYEIDIDGNRFQRASGFSSTILPNGNTVQFKNIFWSKRKGVYLSIAFDFIDDTYVLCSVVFTNSNSAPIETYLFNFSGPLAPSGIRSDCLSAVELESGNIAFAGADDRIYLSNENGFILQRADWGAGASLTLASVGDDLFVSGIGGTNNLKRVKESDIRESAIVQQTTIKTSNNDLSGKLGSLLVNPASGSTNNTFFLIEPFSGTTVVYDAVAVGLDCLASFQKPEINPLNRVFENVELLPDGRFKGPLIKLVLLKIFGQVSADYLDDVFNLRVTPEGIQLGTGSSSFLLLGIEDDFIFSNGAKVEIQHDAGLFEV